MHKYLHTDFQEHMRTVPGVLIEMSMRNESNGIKTRYDTNSCSKLDMKYQLDDKLSGERERLMYSHISHQS